MAKIHVQLNTTDPVPNGRNGVVASKWAWETWSPLHYLACLKLISNLCFFIKQKK